MAKKKAAKKPVRPERLTFKRSCGDCEYLTGYNPSFKGNCQEVFDVSSRSRACVKFSLLIRPRRYRRDADIAVYIKTAEKYAFLGDLLDEATTLARSGVFVTLKRGKDRDDLVTDAADLLESMGNERNNLAPLYEKIQRMRDRAIAILAEAKMAARDLDTIFDRASSTLLRKYPEVREVKPAAVRSQVVDDILDSIDRHQVMADSLTEVCELVVRNAQSAHSAVLEIQASFNSNPAPFRRLPGQTRGGRGKGSGGYIRRKGDLKR